MRLRIRDLAWIALATSALAADAPPPPVAESLRVTPSSLVLSGPRDARRVLVTAVSADGTTFDATSSARFETPDGLAIDASGFFHPRADGAHTVKVSAAGKVAEFTVTAKGVTAHLPVSFVRDVMPVISRVGCNAGTCHGSAKGKKGFKLSLRGYDPEYDYAQLVDDLAGRRFNRSDPDQSLMLLKPASAVPHEGGFVLPPDSDRYHLLRDWIAEGVISDVGKTARASTLEVFPPVIDLAREGQTQQMLVLAHYPDGATRDVTADAVFNSSVPDVATVSASGLVTSVRRGEAAILVRYEGVYGVDNVTVMGDRSGYQWTPRPSANYIDELVDKKLRKVKVLPSALCTDEEFLRRVSIDLTGLPPRPEDVRAFLSDASADKRDRAIDRLIGTPDFVAHWTHKWADLLQANRKLLGDKATWAFDRWIETAVATNLPYDRMVRELMTARGGSIDSPTVNYFRAQKEPTVRARERHPALPGDSVLLQQVPRPSLRALDPEPVLRDGGVLGPGRHQGRAARGG